jgi:DNA polymerase
MEVQIDLFDAAGNDILMARGYEEFRSLLKESNCSKCQLHESRRQIVVDRGNHQSSILVIGEAPGENEDIEGKAFVGRAGKLLDEIVKGIGLETDEGLLIANIVKCKPPDNRSPLADEAKACLPFLKKQISLVRPRVVLLLGATALKHMMPEKVSFAMEKEAGTFLESAEYPGIRFMVLYHPAYLLRDPRRKADMARHVKTLEAFLRKEGIL